jgi:hypothetical protein
VAHVQQRVSEHRKEQPLRRGLLVRARRPGDLQRCFGNKYTVEVDDLADYRYRAVVSIEDILDLMRTQLCQYPNFKSSVNDKQLKHALVDVWATMARLQPRPGMRPPAARVPLFEGLAPRKPLGQRPKHTVVTDTTVGGEA